MFYIQYQAKNNSQEIRKTPTRLDLEKLFDSSQPIINNISNNNKNPNVIIVIILAICAVITTITILFFVKSNKRYKEKIRSAEETINGNKDIIQSKDKIIDDISKRLVILEPNESFDDAYRRFCESSIYIKIKSSFEGMNILIKNIQNYNKLALSNKDINLLVKTFNSCFPKAISSIKKEFDLPEYYGENRDALWDSLDCYCRENLLVQIVGLNTLSKEMMEYIDEILGVFSNVHEENPNITFEIIS